MAYSDAPAGPKSQAERDAVALCRAKLALAKSVYGRREPKIRRNREILAGQFPTWLYPGGGSTKDSAPDLGGPPPIEQVNTNLPLRVTTFLKAQVATDEWDIGYPRAGDLPEEIKEDITSFLQKVADVTEAPAEMADGVDDLCTVGPGVLFVGVNRDVVDMEAAGGAAVPVADLILAAANSAPYYAPDGTVGPGVVQTNAETGQDEVVLLEIPRGADVRALGKAARDFAANEETQFTKTQEQIENLLLLAQAADKALDAAMEARPEGYQYGDLWVKRLVYSDDVLWDGTVTTSWKDARWLARFIDLTEEQAQNEPAFKPSARKHLRGVDTTKDNGPGAPSPVLGADDATGQDFAKRIRIVEWWDRDTGEVHYFTESGCYDGFLERDSKYPYLDERNRSIFPHWFPVACCIANTHNLRVPERTLGIPVTEPGEPHLRQFILFDSAYLAATKKSGRIVEVPAGLTPVQREAIENGADCVVIERPAIGVAEGKNLVNVVTYGQAPVDYNIGRDLALQSYARSVDVSIPELTGVAAMDTFGQEELAAAGARTARSGLIRKVERWAADVVYCLAALARRFYTDERVTELMGPEFTQKDPAMVPDGMGGQVPAIDPGTGQPVLLPSVWELFKTSSLLGDKFEVRFAANARGDDLLQQKADADFLAQTMTAVSPVTGLPFKDPRPVLEKIARARGFGKLPDYQPSPGEMAMAQAISGAKGEGEPTGEGGDDSRETPGGGRSDGRRARGERGPAPVPGRQTRGRTGDYGDEAVRVGRVSTQ